MVTRVVIGMLAIFSLKYSYYCIKSWKEEHSDIGKGGESNINLR